MAWMFDLYCADFDSITQFSLLCSQRQSEFDLLSSLQNFQVEYLLPEAYRGVIMKLGASFTLQNET